MPSLKLWESMSLNWGDSASFDDYASKAVPFLEKQTIRTFIVALVSFGAGLVAMHYGGIALGAALLVLAVHYDQQSSKSHLLLVLTAYHRALARTLDRQTVGDTLRESP